MAVIKKTLFPKNLDNYSVLVNDTDVDSKYFKVTSLPDAFTGGKNAFLIAGSEYLVPDTKIQIELKDASGNIIYHEPGEGYISSSLNGVPFVTEYYEGISKVVSVYVYPDTAYGPCTLTILGELSSYESDSGITSIVPLDWENKYNVKWQRQINVDPSLANTTKIRFYQRPQVTITEVLNPIYRIESGSKVDSGINQSFADIKLSNLETFAGDVKRVKVFRTSEGDISDYDLIQDILVESKELLTSYGLSGSVVGETGILTLETLKNYWNTGSLNAFLTSSRVESGVRLTGSGYFTYTSSLDIKSANTYELNLDAFYSSSTSSNLGVYLSWVSQSYYGPLTMSSSIATLNGTTPSKNLLDTVIPFKIDKDFVSASLYFSQSQGEWHLGNISLKLSQDTAFSPDEISFVTTMPTVIGNETYNFKFEFYDVNNNYVPVAVTQSATFTGGTNTSNTILLISASTSQSLAALTAVSSSISGTVTSNSSSTNIKINNVSSSISGSLYTLSGSIANELILTSGSVTLLSGSFLQFTQSITTTVNSLSQSVSASVLNISGAINAATASLSASLSASVAYTIYSASQYLDKFIFTDENGKINQTPTASSPGLYLGSDHLGYFSGSSWKTYMDNQGDFYLTGSTNNFLAWSSQLGTLQVQGVINIQGGNAATTSSLNNATSSLLGSINNATASLSSSLAPNIFTDVSGNIHRPPNVMVNYSNGLFLGSTHLGYYSGSDWKTYMQNNGNFFLSGAGSDSLSWSSGVLSINGAINITGGNAATDVNALLYATRAATSASVSGSSALTAASNAATSASASGSSALTAASNAATSASAVDDKVFTNALGRITKVPVSGSTAGLYLGSTNLGYYNGSTWRTYMDNSGLFYLTGSNNGNALLWDGSTLTIKGTIKVSDGTEVTNATVTGATSGSTSLQSGNTGKSLGLTGGSIGGVTIASTKIYVGTGTWGHSNTGFYVDSTGQFSLKDKLTWNGTTLSVIGDITVGSTLLTEAAILNTSTTAANVGLGNVSNLTPQNQAQTGLISGTTITGGGITLSGGGNIKGGQTDYNTGTGFFLGYHSSAYKFSIGNASTKGITWDGSTLSIGGDVNIGASLASTVVSSITNINSTTSSLNSSVSSINSTTSSINSSISQINTATGSIVPASQILNHIGGSSITTITGAKVTTGQIKSGTHTGTADGSAFSTAGMSIDLDGGGISAKNFRITGAGAAFFSGSVTAGTGTIGGWVIGNTFLSSSNGKIIFNSSTPEISYTGAPNANFKLSTGYINDIASNSETLKNTTYMGDGGMIFLGERDGSDNLKNYMRFDNYSGYSRAIFYDDGTSAINYDDEIVWINKVTDSNSAALRVDGGGIVISSVSLGANAGYVLQGGGDATFSGDVTANTSDGRLKTNIVNIDSPLEKISKINGVYFNWNELAKELTDKDTEKREVGFIAQEVQSVMPEIIKPAAFDVKLKSGENYLTIQYEKIVPLLVECIKELKKEIDELKNK